MITAIASALHGHNTATKGAIMAGHALCWAGIGYLFIGWVGLVMALPALAWWFTLRTGKQARAELDCMDTFNEPHPTYMDVLKAHYFTGWLTILALRFYNYDTRPDLINNGKFWDIRRPTEIATGLTGDVLLTLVLLGLWCAW